MMRGDHRFRDVLTAAEADALPVGSVIADIYEPDSPAVACKAARGDWQFLGEDPERRYWSQEILPKGADSPRRFRVVLLWSPEWAQRSDSDIAAFGVEGDWRPNPLPKKKPYATGGTVESDAPIRMPDPHEVRNGR